MADIMIIKLIQVYLFIDIRLGIVFVWVIVTFWLGITLKYIKFIINQQKEKKKNIIDAAEALSSWVMRQRPKNVVTLSQHYLNLWNNSKTQQNWLNIVLLKYNVYVHRTPCIMSTDHPKKKNWGWRCSWLIDKEKKV